MKNSKKLLVAIAALVVSLAVSVGSTFAWFTTNTKVDITNIQANVTSGDSNLEVALVDATTGAVDTFAYTIDLGTKLKSVIENLKWDALTDKGANWSGTTTNGATLTDKSKSEAKLPKATPATTDSENYEKYQEDPSDWQGNYLQFILQFRTTSETADESGVSLKFNAADSSVTSKNGNKTPEMLAWDDDSLKTWGLTTNNKIDAKAENVMRVAFHPVVTAASTAPSITTNAGKVWDPHKGVGYEEKTDDIKLSQVIDEYLQKKTTNELDEYYEDPGYTDLASDYSSPVEVAKMTKAGDSDYYVATIAVTIWLEGTDDECINAIFDQLVTIALNFTI